MTRITELDALGDFAEILQYRFLLLDLEDAATLWRRHADDPSLGESLDMEGVLTPEIWIAVAEKTGIAELRRTTLTSTSKVWASEEVF